jgi:hypothetical protein
MLARPGIHATLCVGEISEHIIVYKKYFSRVNFENLPNLTMNSVATVPPNSPMRHSNVSLRR